MELTHNLHITTHDFITQSSRLMINTMSNIEDTPSNEMLIFSLSSEGGSKLANEGIDMICVISPILLTFGSHIFIFTSPNQQSRFLEKYYSMRNRYISMMVPAPEIRSYPVVDTTLSELIPPAEEVD